MNKQYGDEEHQYDYQLVRKVTKKKSDQQAIQTSEEDEKDAQALHQAQSEAIQEFQK